MARVRVQLLGAVLVTVAHAAAAQSTDYQRAQIVVERQPMMFELQTAYWTLLDLRNGKSDDYGEGAAAARVMAEQIAAFAALMVPGTARGEAPGSRARPEVWTQAESFAAAVDLFVARAEALAEAADAGDAAAYPAAFDALTEACTACHGFRPSAGGPFRFALDE